MYLDDLKITYPFSNSVAGFYVGPKAAQEALRWVRNRFGLEVESEAIYERGNLFDSIRTVFLPNLVELCVLDEFAEEMAVLLMDNLSSHITSGMIGLLTEGRLRITTFAPHTTQIFQVFDMALVVALKKHPRYELPFTGEKAMESRIATL
jgi:hypothetical protein